MKQFFQSNHLIALVISFLVGCVASAQKQPEQVQEVQTKASFVYSIQFEKP